MWTGMILMCSVIVENDCVAIGGPNFPTQEECLIDLQRKGLPYVTQKFYDHKAIDYQCVHWGERT
jgi:hypothetical protein